MLTNRRTNLNRIRCMLMYSSARRFPRIIIIAIMTMMTKVTLAIMTLMTWPHLAEAFQVVCWPGPASIFQTVLGRVVWNICIRICLYLYVE